GLLALSGILDHLLQLTTLVQLSDNVTSADQLAIDIELRIGGPVGISLQCLANIRMFQNIHISELLAAGHKSLNCTGRKATLRHLGCAFHIKKNLIAF